MREIELKAKVSDVNQLHTKLKKLGIVFSEPVTQKDIVYGMRKADGWVHSKQWLRLRTEQGIKHIFTMKRTLGAGLDSLEYETVVESPDAIQAILEDIGYEHYCTLTKTRSKAKYIDFEICLDKVEELDGNFIEVEKLVDIEASHDKVVAEIRLFMQALGINPGDEIEVGYDVMVLQKENLAT